MPHEQYGRFGENVVAYWLQSRGNSILPIRDIDMGDVWKGPRMTGPSGMELVTTDWLVTNQQSRKMVYIEVKRKTVFSWHRISRDWVTGIDQHYLDHYLCVRNTSSIPMWILFVHLNGMPADTDQDEGSPGVCPTGLFGAEILTLAKAVHHTHSNWGKGGMVYWGIPPLKLLASLEELEPIIAQARKAMNGGVP